MLHQKMFDYVMVSRIFMLYWISGYQLMFAQAGARQHKDGIDDSRSCVCMSGFVMVKQENITPEKLSFKRKWQIN
jgi:hypothetical protein